MKLCYVDDSARNPLIKHKDGMKKANRHLCCGVEGESLWQLLQALAACEKKTSRKV